MDNKLFTIPYILDNTPNLPEGHQLTSQVKQNVWVVKIGGEELGTDKGALCELNWGQSKKVKSKVRISLCKNKILSAHRFGGTLV